MPFWTAPNAFMHPHPNHWEQHFQHHTHNPQAARFQHMYHHMYRRGPSRIIWFLIGGAAFTWFHHVKERKFIQAQQASQDGRGGFTSCWYGPDWHKSWHERRAAIDARAYDNRAAAAERPVPVDMAPADPRVAPEPRFDVNVQVDGDRWAEERSKIKQVGQQATDAVVDVAELSLDGVLSAVDTLRVKLAELRAAREKIRSETPPNADQPRKV